MVLRDKRDLGKKQQGPGCLHLDTLASECGYRYKNKRIRKILSKKNIKIKKNINNVIVFELKRSHNKKEKKIKQKKKFCVQFAMNLTKI